MPRRLLTLLLIAAAAATGLAACGGVSRDTSDYIEAVNGAQSRFERRFEQLSRGIDATSTAAEDRRTLSAFGRAVDAAVRELRAIDVPMEVQAEHRSLVADIGRYGTEIDRARRAFSSNDPQRILAAQTQLVSSVTAVSQRINRTIAAINDKLDA